MTFEEDFPSLKCKAICSKFYESDIQEHCLDKQKVREAIEKLNERKQNGYWLPMEAIVMLEKKLGL